MSNQLSQAQLAIAGAQGLALDEQSMASLFEPTLAKSLSVEQLVATAKFANALYRAGFPVITDTVYDSVFIAELQAQAPEHEFLSQVEPEAVVEAKTVVLPQKMLSTDKAYSQQEIVKWLDRIKKAANEVDVADDELVIRVTPKLDGYAAFDDGERLYTRGDGVRGQDISRAFERGLQVASDKGERGLGAGEIVISKSYFEEKLSATFENSRNIQAAIIAEKNIEPQVQQAIDDGACVFYPFSLIENWQGHYQILLDDFDAIIERIWNAVDYDVDGVILEAVNDAVKTHMGATRKFHRWQIAFKVNQEVAEVVVNGITPQTSRTGRISPVAELEPTKLSGATLSRATVHHYGMVKAKGVGPGAIVQLVRSGLVIPKIEKVIKAVEPEFPKQCPSCGGPVVWDGDHIVCPNTTACPAQTENTMSHFFKTLGNIDGFGPKVIAKLHLNGINKIHEIYDMSQHQFRQMGFGDKTADNLFNQLAASRAIEIEDWRFLAAFGVNRLGGGNCERLLEHYKLTELFSLSVDDMVKIDGFAQLSAEAAFEGLQTIKDEFDALYALGFSLKETVRLTDRSDDESPIAGKVIVFTGTMVQGSRGDMEKQAKALGAKVAKSVSGKTTYLVAGEKVGANKTNAAREKGVTVLSEQEYLDLLR